MDGVALSTRVNRLGVLIDQATPAVEEATSALRRTGTMARTALEGVERVSGPEVEAMSRSLLSSFSSGAHAEESLVQVTADLAHAVGHSGAMAEGSRALLEARRAEGTPTHELDRGISR